MKQPLKPRRNHRGQPICAVCKGGGTLLLVARVYLKPVYAHVVCWSQRQDGLRRQAAEQKAAPRGG